MYNPDGRVAKQHILKHARRPFSISVALTDCHNVTISPNQQRMRLDEARPEDENPSPPQQ
jgi:hypothetical protein